MCGKSARTVLRGALKLSDMAEYGGTPTSKERSNREYKACLSERAILRLLDAPTRENGAILGGCFVTVPQLPFVVTLLATFRPLPACSSLRRVRSDCSLTPMCEGVFKVLLVIFLTG